MAITLLNCLSETNDNAIIENCCCNYSCTILADKDSSIIDRLDFNVAVGWDVSNVLIDGNPVSVPFVIGANSSVELSFSICNRGGGAGSIVLDIRDIAMTSYVYDFPMIAVQLGSIVSTAINFGDLAIGYSTTQYLSIEKSISCCANYDFSGLTTPFSIQTTQSICNGSGSMLIPISFMPTSIGLFEQNLDITFNECATTTIIVSGRGIEPTVSGNPVDGAKKKIAQSESNPCMTGNVFKCEPFNPIVKQSIQKISRQLPGGGSGRGTKFSR